jgi:hypothetical protein
MDATGGRALLERTLFVGKEFKFRCETAPDGCPQGRDPNKFFGPVSFYGWSRPGLTSRAAKFAGPQGRAARRAATTRV